MPPGLDSGSFYPYVVATAIATAISTVFIVAPLVIAPSRVDLDKSSAYECGFDAFGEVGGWCGTGHVGAWATVLGAVTVAE